MIIRVDDEGKKVMESFFDVALKAGGISNFNTVVKAMDAVESIDEEPEETKTKKIRKG